MKKYKFIAPVTFLAALLILSVAHASAPERKSDQSQQNQWYCPYGAYQGGYGMGPGTMGYYGMEPGTKWPGYSYNQQNLQPQRPIKEKDAKGIVENYLNSTRNPNLKLGKIKDEGSDFEVDIVTKRSGTLVEKVLVSKNTGWLRSAY